MRGGFGLLRNSNGVVRSRVIGEAVKLVSCSPFSTSSGSGAGGGGGRGRGSFSPTKFDFSVGGGSSSSPGEVVSNEGLNDTEKSDFGMGRGHGRGKPLAMEPIAPSFNTFVAFGEPSQQPPGIGLGRGGVRKEVYGPGNEGELGNEQVASGEPSQRGPGLALGADGAGKQEYGPEHDGESRNEMIDGVFRQPIGELNLAESTMTTMTGMGRGQPGNKVVHEEKPEEVNRHLGARRGDDSGAGRGKNRYESKGIDSEREKQPKLSREEAIQRAVSILASKDDGRGPGGRGAGRGARGGRGRGGRGGRGSRDNDEKEKEADLLKGACEESKKLASMLGPKVMNELTEALGTMSKEILPNPAEDAYNEALDLNLQFEFEPEYLMGNFEENPDISGKRQIPVRDALEKMKPLLMQLEGMESNEEWEEALEETMKNVPKLKEMLRHYAGPRRLTAEQQCIKLKKVTKRLPVSAPDGVTDFTNRALLALQSNPGWQLNQKRAFMAKLMKEISKSYK